MTVRPTDGTAFVTRARNLLTMRNVGLLLALVGISQLFLQLALLRRGTEYVVTTFPNDDTYYYLQAAWNAKRLGVVTFDGIHRTNGVQFLWFALIFLLTFLTSDKITLLYATLATSFVLNVLSYVVIWRIGKELNRPLLALLSAAAWSVISFAVPFYSTGMENSLHAFVFWCVIWQIIVFVKRVRKREAPNIMALVVVLVLNAWSRIDSGLLSAIFFVFCVATLYFSSEDRRAFIRKYGRSVGMSLSVAVLGALILLASYYGMAQTYLPISSLVKSAPTGPAGVEFAILWLHALRMTAGGLLPQPFAPFILVGMTSAVTLIHLERDSFGLVALRRIWYVLLGAWMLYHALLLWSGALGDWQENFWYYWYLAPWHILFAISFGLLIDRFVALIAGEGYRIFDTSGRLRGAGLARTARFVSVALATIVLLLSYRLHFNRVGAEMKPNVYAVGYRAARWLDRHLPQDVILASWNAGQFGYFSNRSVVNLDGLMNDAGYYDQVLLGEKPLAVYLEESGVDYVIDYEIANRVYRQLRSPETDGDLSLESFRTFPISGDEKSIHIWRVATGGSGNADG